MPVYDRWLRTTLEQLLAEEAVLVLRGPRACGKTTLVTALAGELGRDVVDFGDPRTLAIASQDPASYLQGRQEPVIIDEFQRLPDVLAYVKRSVDRTPREGAFLLTGSTTHHLLPQGSETLAGRSHELTLWPLSQGELRGTREHFVTRVFAEPKSLLAQRHQTDRIEYARLLTTGGFPDAVRRTRPEARARWLTDYAARVVERDLADLIRLRNPGAFRSTLALCAVRTAEILNVSTFANELDTNRDTVGSYIELLERVMLVHRLRPYANNLGTRLTAHPKLHITDSGLAGALCRIDASTLARSERFGPILETFVVNEVMKQLSWELEPPTAWFFRDREQNEVDMVLEHPDGRIVGIEVKSSTTVDRGDAGGLRRLASLAGSRFHHGIVLYTGESSIRLSDDGTLSAHPVASLWQP